MPLIPCVDCTIRTFSPSGRQTSAELGPQRTTQGNPAAAARWVMPESCPTNPRHNWRYVASVGSGSSSANCRRAAGMSFPKSCSRSRSASPPTRRRFHPAFSISASISLRHFSTGQFFRSLPLPGCNASQSPVGIDTSADRGIVNCGVGSASKIDNCSSGLSRTRVA